MQWIIESFALVYFPLILIAEIILLYCEVYGLLLLLEMIYFSFLIVTMGTECFAQFCRTKKYYDRFRVFKCSFLRQDGAGTIRLEMISSVISWSEGGGGQTRLSMRSSVVLNRHVTSGGSARQLRIIKESDSSSCNTDSMYIMSKSPTRAPLMTIISSPLMIPIVAHAKPESPC